MKLGLLEWMFLIFFVLKLVGEIDWSWWWVTCPMWIIPLIYLVLFAGFADRHCRGRVLGLHAKGATGRFDSAAGSNMIKLNIVTK